MSDEGLKLLRLVAHVMGPKGYAVPSPWRSVVPELTDAGYLDAAPGGRSTWTFRATLAGYAFLAGVDHVMGRL